MHGSPEVVLQRSDVVVEVIVVVVVVVVVEVVVVVVVVVVLVVVVVAVVVDDVGEQLIVEVVSNMSGNFIFVIFNSLT